MSASEYYTRSGYPSQGAFGSSSAARAEFDNVQTGFGKLPDLSGNGGKMVAVNSGASALEAVTTTGTGNAVRATSPTLTTPNIGAATGTSLAVSGALTSSGTSGVGYATGAGGTVTQLTSKSTGVTLNKRCGVITTHDASLAAGATVRFALSNSTIGEFDVIVPILKSGGTASSYNIWADVVSAGTCGICIRNISGGALAQAINISFVVIKGVDA